MTEVAAAVDVAAPMDVTWAAAIDWARQGEWMLFTDVRGGHGLGAEVEAFTGFGRLGFLDTMVITAWDPPYRCVVKHTGKVVRGSAVFEVEELPGGRSRFVWAEWLELPLGLVGRLGFALLRPLVVLALRVSMRRFARYAAGYPRR